MGRTTRRKIAFDLRQVAPLAVALIESNFPPMVRLLYDGQLTDGFDQRGQLLIVRTDPCIQFCKFCRQRPVVYEELSQSNKRTDNVDAHFVGSLAVEDVCSLDGTMLGESRR